MFYITRLDGRAGWSASFDLSLDFYFDLVFSRIYVPSRVLCQVAAKITAETITNIPTFSGVDKVASAEHADNKSFLHFAPYVRLRCFMCESFIVRRIPIRKSFFSFLSKSNIRDDRSSIRRCTQQNFFFAKYAVVSTLKIKGCSRAADQRKDSRSSSVSQLGSESAGGQGSGRSFLQVYSACVQFGWSWHVSFPEIMLRVMTLRKQNSILHATNTASCRATDQDDFAPSESGVNKSCTTSGGPI